MVPVSHGRHCAGTLGGININSLSINHVFRELKSSNRNNTFPMPYNFLKKIKTKPTIFNGYILYEYIMIYSITLLPLHFLIS